MSSSYQILKKTKRTFVPDNKLQIFGLNIPKIVPMKILAMMSDLMGPIGSRFLSIILGYSLPTRRTIRLKEYFLELPDGAKMATDVFLPKDVWKARGTVKGKAPTIMVRMPYWKDVWAFVGRFFATWGYAAVFQDIRGCGHSNPYGTSSLMLTDRDDGLATLRWIAKQFWYNGKIGTWGASYLGLTQWGICWDNDNLLTCMSPSITSFTNIWAFRQGLNINELSASVACILLNTGGNQELPHNFNDLDSQGFTKKMVQDPAFMLYNDKMSSLGELQMARLKDFEHKSIAEKQAIMFKRTNLKIDFAKSDFKIFYFVTYMVLVKHAINTVHRYMPANIDMDFSKITAPIYMMSGWGDMFCENTLRDYMELMRKLPEAVMKNVHIIIGPWCHFCTSTSQKSLANGGMLRYAKEMFCVPFYERWLKDKPNEIDTMAPVRIFVQGKNRWREEKEWPLSRAQPQTWYLHSEGNANSAKGDGKLTQRLPEREFTDRYIFNPLDPVFTAGGRNLFIPKKGRHQIASESRQDVMVYTSPKLKQGIEATGKVEFILYASTSVIDTDFMVKLCDVHPNGRSINILDGGVRCRFRSGARPEPLIPDEIYPFEIDLGHTSYYFKKGHRIRVDVTSSNFPRFDVNSNLGGQFSKRGFEKAEQRIYHTEGKESALILPVIPD